MKIFDERKSSAEEISRLLKKKAFDEVELSPRVAAGTEKMFGQKLTAAQVVDRIVGEIRKGGDERLFYYTKLLDGGDFTKDTIAVTEKEFEEAEKAVDTKTMEAISRAISNVRKFHEEQLPKTWLTPRAYGSFLGQKMTRRHLCAGRYGGVPVQRHYECRACHGGRCAPHRDGSACQP